MATSNEKKTYRTTKEIQADFLIIRQIIEKENVSSFAEVAEHFTTVTGRNSSDIYIKRTLSTANHPIIEKKLRMLLEDRKKAKKTAKTATIQADDKPESTEKMQEILDESKVSDENSNSKTETNLNEKPYVIDLSIIGGYITEDGSNIKYWYEFIENKKNTKAKFIITSVTSDEIDKMLACGSGDSTEAKMAKKLAKMSLGDNFEYVDIPSYKKEESSNDERDNYIVEFSHANNCHLLTADVKMATWAKRKSVSYTLFSKSRVFYKETTITPCEIIEGNLYFRGVSTDTCKYFVNEKPSTTGYTPLECDDTFIISCKKDYGKVLIAYKITNIATTNNAVLVYKKTYTSVNELPETYRKYAL